MGCRGVKQLGGPDPWYDWGGPVKVEAPKSNKSCYICSIRLKRLLVKYGTLSIYEITQIWVIVDPLLPLCLSVWYQSSVHYALVLYTVMSLFEVSLNIYGDKTI